MNLTQLGSSYNSTANASSYTTGSYDFTAGKWYIAGIGHSAGTTGNLKVPVLSGVTSGTWGNGLGSISFNVIGTALMRVSGRSFLAATSFSETLAITTTGGTTSSVALIICECDSDPAGSLIVSSNIASDHSDASTTAQTTTPLNSFADATNNGTLLICVKAATSALTAGSGMTEIAQQSVTTPDLNLGVFFRTGEDVSPTATLTSAAWGALSSEIQANAATVRLGYRPYMGSTQRVRRAAWW
jgi:hypothetical protein